MRPWTAVLASAALLAFSACSGNAPSSSGPAPVGACCQKTAELKAQIPKCCAPSLESGAKLSECCAASKADPSKKSECCKRTEELTAQMPECCKKAQAGEPQACCAKK